MIRMYGEFVERILLLLLFVRRYLGADFKAVIGTLQRNGGVLLAADGAEFRSYIAELYEKRFDDVSFEEMITEVWKQLKSKQQRDDGDLIDTIVRVTGLPYPRNALAGQVLQDLRNALLLPEEMAGLQRRLQERELTCYRCTHTFHAGEMATVVPDGRDNILCCVKCIAPSQLPCDGCTANSVPSKQKLKLSNCGCAIQSAAPVKAGTAGPEDPYAGAILAHEEVRGRIPVHPPVVWADTTARAFTVPYPRDPDENR